MKRLAHIAALVVVALFAACSNKVVVRDTEPHYTPRYAQGFTIERDKASGAKLLCVKNPWQGAEGVIYHYERDTLKPPQRIITMSSSHAAMLDAVGCIERIVGISGCRYIYTPSICQAIERGDIGEVGYDTAFDFEIEGTRKKYYSDPEEDALIMTCHFGQAKMWTPFGDAEISFID